MPPIIKDKEKDKSKENKKKGEEENKEGEEKEEEISEAYVAQLLADAMIRMRMTAYGMGVESPSVAGLKLDLDRLRDELGVFLREAKKGAEEYIGVVKEMRAKVDAEEEDDEKPE